MAIGKAISGNPYRDNGATVSRGGNITTGSPVTNAPDTTVQGYQKGNGSVVIAKASQGTGKAVSANAFARSMVSGQYVMMRYGFIAGSQSNFLTSGAADFGRRSIHWQKHRESYHITSWNYVTGAATKGANTTDDFGADHAATPTRAVPGEFQYTDHGMAKSGSLAIPLSADYEAKKG